LKPKPINLKEKFNSFDEHWSPKILGELNGQHVKIAKLKGEFVSHKHDNEDELFYVIEGELLMELETETLEIKTGEMVIIPRGTVHKPVAAEEVKVLLFEPKSTLNTDDIDNGFTVQNLDEI
jgi:mannose-6-phosphate isomerase-like protein (cupin superfamily)